MPLQPVFALSANTPHNDGYDPQAPDAPHFSAFLTSCGGLSGWHYSRSLSGQVANDELIIGNDAVDLDDTSLTPYPEQMWRRCFIEVGLHGYNLSDDHQILLVFGFKKRGWGSAMQFFVGTEWVHSEPIENDTETIALLVDASSATQYFHRVTGDPVFRYLELHARLAAEDFSGRVGFTGVEGFVL